MKHFTLASAKLLGSSKTDGIWNSKSSSSTPSFLISVAEPTGVFLALAASSQPWPGFAPLGGGVVAFGWLCHRTRGAVGPPNPCPRTAGDALLFKARGAHLWALGARSHLQWWDVGCGF